MIKNVKVSKKNNNSPAILKESIFGTSDSRKEEYIEQRYKVKIKTNNDIQTLFKNK